MYANSFPNTQLAVYENVLDIKVYLVDILQLTLWNLNQKQDGFIQILLEIKLLNIA